MAIGKRADDTSMHRGQGRVGSALLLACGLGVGGSVGVGGCGQREDASAMATGGSEASASAGGLDDASDHAADLAAPAVAEVAGGLAGSEPGDEGLERLRAALAAAPGESDNSWAAHYERTLAWVRANREPGASNEVEAKLLAILEQILAGGKLSIAAFAEFAEIEIDMARGMDADGDGELTEAEIDAWIGLGLDNPTKHPYVVERFDTNGDGTLNIAEQMALFSKFMPLANQDNMFSMVGERVMLDRFDADGDGVLSEAERRTGEDALLDALPPVEVMEGQAEAMEARAESIRSDTSLTEEEREQQLAELEMGRTWMEAFGSNDRERRLSVAMLQLGGEYMGTLSLLNDDAAPAVEVGGEEGDPDAGDGAHASRGDDSDVSVEIRFDENVDDPALEEGIAEDAGGGTEEDWRRRMARDQYTNTTRLVDGDGDGTVTGDEWERRMEELRRERDARVFRHHYDLDKDGRVGTRELDTFLTWHGAGSPRADANLDGRVDAADISSFMVAYQDQSRP